MNTYTSIYRYHSAQKTVVTLGTFDGVHKGHQKIIERLVQSAEQCSCESLVLTFFPHPRMVLQDQNEIKLLSTIDERIQKLEALGIDHVVVHPFDQEFSRLTAEEFVEKVLVQHFNIQKIIIGHDHRFGRNRTANIDDLKVFGEKFGFEVEEISAQEINTVSVSSTKIRTALHEGNIETANAYLGYPYTLNGIVITGKGLGKTLRFPTANLKLDADYKLIPQNGVYIVQCLLDGQMLHGMMNIGINPTVDGTQQSIEVHFLDFNASLYHKNLTLQILHRIRDEIKFDSVSELQKQLELDQQTTLAFFENQP
ncbi:bifunctional riboflavin kinase/FAD synthetase [Flavobacterium sp.]|uniref:bifunctional riboflavin kinase/FAD synthetase n=1 Tax=Flavobacterium sp. TaxID=239 RepID=UPI002FD97CF3